MERLLGTRHDSSHSLVQKAAGGIRSNLPITTGIVGEADFHKQGLYSRHTSLLSGSFLCQFFIGEKTLVARALLQASLVELCVGDSRLEVSFGGGCEGGGWDGTGGSEKNV